MACDLKVTSGDCDATPGDIHASPVDSDAICGRSERVSLDLAAGGHVTFGDVDVTFWYVEVAFGDCDAVHRHVTAGDAFILDR